MKEVNPLATAFGHEQRWVVWKLQKVEGRETKVPYTITGRHASSTDPKTWSDYMAADKVAARYSGIGIMFGADGLILGIDIDHVLENGGIVHAKKAEIQKLLKEAATYTEISPSGTGLHLILALSEPFVLVANRKAPYECYTQGRYFTVTGVPYGDARPVRTVAPEEALKILSIIGYPWGSNGGETLPVVPAGKPAPSEDQSIFDAKVLTEMFNSESGAKLVKLYAGDISEYGDDTSRADMALCGSLAHWTAGDEEQIERIWLASPLGNREKTRTRGDYRKRTIKKAVDKYASDSNQARTEAPEPPPEIFDTSKFKELAPEDLLKVLDLTIKHDDVNKLSAFLCQLSAYTENAQFNISFNAPSSSGKSYIPMEVSKLFPQEDVMPIGYSSPMAFFHEQGVVDPLTKARYINLSRKIIIFMDMPHPELLMRLRPLLSHDKKIITSKITDKNQKGGNQTKTIYIEGYPSVIFCTAGLSVDEQEATRFLLLSPEISQEKIREGIEASIRKEMDNEGYASWLESHPDRSLLKERLRAIRSEQVGEVNIGEPKRIQKMLFAEGRQLIPRNQRDVKRLMSLAKAFAVLNMWHRERRGTTVVANESDVAHAIELWEKISVSQELNLPPYVYDLYQKVILAARSDRLEYNPLESEFGDRIGLTYQDILDKHHKVEGRPLPMVTLAKIIIPMLESAGLVAREKSQDDKRMWLVFPLVLNIMDAVTEEGVKNSSDDPGVDTGSGLKGEFDDDISEVFG